MWFPLHSAASSLSSESRGTPMAARRSRAPYAYIYRVGGHAWYIDWLDESYRRVDTTGPFESKPKPKSPKRLFYTLASIPTANPPSGFIPCKAVKITRNGSKVEVRIRK